MIKRTTLLAATAAVLLSTHGAFAVAPPPAPTNTANPVPAVPEPTSALVFGAGALLVGAALRRRHRP